MSLNRSFAPIWALIMLGLATKGLERLTPPEVLGYLALGGLAVVIWGQMSVRTLVVGLVGVCIVVWGVPARQSRSLGRAHLVSLTVSGASMPGARCLVRVREPSGLRLSLPAQPCVWAQGDRIEIPASRFQRYREGQRRSIYVTHYVGHTRDREGFWVAVAAWRRRLFARCDPHSGAMLALASVAGMPQVLRRYWRTRLREAGLGHLTAVSGLHVGTLAQGFTWVLVRVVELLRGARRRRRRLGFDGVYACAVGAASGFVLLFVLLTGASASAWRALLCWLVVSGMVIFGASLHRLSMLGWIAWGMLVCCPAWWASPGFYFSFVATAILMWPLPNRQSEWMTSWRLTWGLAPLSLWFFAKASMLSALANLVAIPVFSFWVMPIGLLAIVVAAVGSCLGLADVVEEVVFQLFLVAGRGGSLILAVARGLGGYELGAPWHWSVLCAWVLVLYPGDSPGRLGRWLELAPRPLLWFLVFAPLWVG